MKLEINENERLQAWLDEIEKSVFATNGPFAEVTDILELIALLQVAFCDHRFVLRRMGGAPDNADSVEMVKVCEICGFEL